MADEEYIEKRIIQLILSQVTWAFIYFLIYFMIGLILRINLVNGISDLFWQIFTGHSETLNATMRFQTNLIVISIVLLVIFHFLNEKTGLFIIVILSCVCLFFQYSGINYRLFGSFRYELSYPLGRVIEMFPIATFGFIVSRFDLITLFKNNCIKNLIVLCILSITFIVLDHKIFVISRGFGYAGIWKLLVGYTLTSLAYNCDFTGIVNPLFIKFITKHTLGIYCGHRLIKFVLYNIYISMGIQTGMFWQCVLIYVVGFIVFELASKIPFKLIKYII